MIQYKLSKRLSDDSFRAYLRDMLILVLFLRHCHTKNLVEEDVLKIPSPRFTIP